MQQVRYFFLYLLLAWPCYGALLPSRAIFRPCAPEVEFLGAQASAAILVCASDLPKECAVAKRGDRAVPSEGGCQVLAEQMVLPIIDLGLPLDLNRVEVEDLVLL